MNNPQAFPSFYIEGHTGEYQTIPTDGMTLLDHFAGRVAPVVIKMLVAPSPKDIATESYDIAEAMVKESERRMK